MTHLDLFSGIGGFAYAVDQVWDNVEHIFCDNDDFCKQVLKKHWPEAKIYDDIRQLITDTRRTSRKSGSATAKENQRLGRIDILTGGFPCQPFSQAGARGGTDDDRYLWPEMLEVIRLTKPTWVIAENVSGILTWDEGVVFEQVCSDLEATGFEVQPFIIPAAAVGAPHRRDRVWFVAHSVGDKHRGRRRPGGKAQGLSGVNRPAVVQSGQSGGASKNASNTQQPRLERRNQQTPEHREDKRLQFRPEDWKRDWLEVATELCRVDDGLPAELGGLKLSKSKHRAEQLKAYGNAIVPEVAMEIMRGMTV